MLHTNVINNCLVGETFLTQCPGFNKFAKQVRLALYDSVYINLFLYINTFLIFFTFENKWDLHSYTE